MKIHDLAALVTIRNHIVLVMNDKTVSKTDLRTLVDARFKLDKKFVESIKELDFDNLYPLTVLSYNDILDCKNVTGTSGYVHVEATKDILDVSQMEKPLMVLAQEAAAIEPDIKSSPSGIWEEEVQHSTQEHQEKDYVQSDADNESEEKDLAVIQERIKAQKEQLKKEGRSNKRISKNKDDSK